MKTAALVGLTVALVAATTLVSPLVALGLAAVGYVAHITHVYDRVFEVLLAVAIAVGWRQLDLGGPAAWGFRRAGGRRELARGLAIGIAGVAAGLAVAWLAGSVVPALRFDPLKTVRKAVLGMLGALLVGVGEETLFRGVLLRRFVLDCGPRGGVLLTTSVYAIVHALRGGGRIEATGLAAGWARTAGLFAPLADPTVWPGVVGLFGLGLVLAAARRRTGALWVPIGIHAAWVGVFRVGRLFVDIRQRPAWAVGPGWPPLVGGVAGGVALVVTALLVRRMLRDAPRRFPP